MSNKELSQQAKEYLTQIPKTDRLIKRLTDTAHTLRSSLTSYNFELKQDVVRSSGPQNPIESVTIKITDLEKQIDDRIKELVDMKAEAEQKIRALPDFDQQNILIARYVQGKKWEMIAVELNFSMRQVHRIHGTALLGFARKNTDILKDGTL